jgi:hypothetical protein
MYTYKVFEIGLSCGSCLTAAQEFFYWFERWIGYVRYKRIPERKLGHNSDLMYWFQDSIAYFDLDDDIEMALPPECGLDSDENLNIEDQVPTITK